MGIKVAIVVIWYICALQGVMSILGICSAYCTCLFLTRFINDD